MTFDAQTIDALTKFVTTSGVIGVLLLILYSLFRVTWMPTWVHDRIVKNLTDSHEKEIGLLKESLRLSEQENERYRTVILASYEVTKDAIAVSSARPR